LVSTFSSWFFKVEWVVLSGFPFSFSFGVFCWPLGLFAPWGNVFLALLRSMVQNTKRAILVLTLILDQSGQPEAKMPKKCQTQAKVFNNILTLGKKIQEYFIIKPKCPSQNMIWLVFKLCGLGFNIMPKLIYFEPMFLGLWLKVTS